VPRTVPATRETNGKTQEEKKTVNLHSAVKGAGAVASGSAKERTGVGAYLKVGETRRKGERKESRRFRVTLIRGETDQDILLHRGVVGGRRARRIRLCQGGGVT